MFDDTQLDNPFAPPRELPSGDAAADDLKLWRDGGRLMIRNGAEFPPVCFLTGVPTKRSVVVQHIWQPLWVYFLLFPLIFPYFLVSPFLHRKVTLELPLAEPLYRVHQAKVHRGVKLLTIGIALFGVWLIIPALMRFPSGLVMGASIVCILTGLILASRQPLRLSVERIQGDTLVLTDVNELFLQQLPPGP